MDILIDWGDNSEVQLSSPGQFEHEYASDGVYIIKISGSLEAFGFYDSQKNSFPTLVEVISFGNLGIKDLSDAFNMASQLIKVPATLPSSVTTMTDMFNSLEIFNDPNIKSWDVSNVLNMRGLFEYTDIFDQDLRSWVISQDIIDDPELCTYFSASVDVLQCIHLPENLPDECRSDCID